MQIVLTWSEFFIVVGLMLFALLILWALIKITKDLLLDRHRKIYRERHSTIPVTPRIILRRGLASQLKPGVLHERELGFNVDTNELMIGTSDGSFVKIGDVIVGPDYGLYHSAPEGFIPLCIRP